MNSLTQPKDLHGVVLSSSPPSPSLPALQPHWVSWNPVDWLTALAIWYASMPCIAGKLRTTFPRSPLQLPARDLIVPIISACGRLHFGPQLSRREAEDKASILLVQTGPDSVWFCSLPDFVVSCSSSSCPHQEETMWFGGQKFVSGSSAYTSKPENFLSSSFSDFVNH